ncbi:sigma factor-like helix-turn-helix DNA-binding protein [Pseudofrankia sp. DC12]|uniref:sigma factor-like helix-turn-helix DNA-binding protein n=1 Tax=Pseudofrankia sp. DC12 TaxID=683315 RepID=UPI0005F7F2C6|nr:sigma factor-like helix-turn-helix DNA-binding protein [Pseudofrankia sp. DC12]
MTGRCRERLIELRYVEGQSIAATAQIVGVAEATVKRHTLDAVRALHATLAGTARPARTPVTPLAELRPAAYEIAAEIAEAGQPWNRPALIAAFAARGIALSRDRAGVLVREIRPYMPEASNAVRYGVGARRATGGAQ